MRSVAKARPMHCAILAKELDTWIWAKPRRSISRAKSSVARRRPGVAIRLRAGKGEGMGFLQEYFVDHSRGRSAPIVIPGRRTAASPESIFQRPVFMDSGPSPAGYPGMTSNGARRFYPYTYGRMTGPRVSGTVAAFSFQSFDHGVTGRGTSTPSTRLASTCSLRNHR